MKNLVSVYKIFHIWISGPQYLNRIACSDVAVTKRPIVAAYTGVFVGTGGSNCCSGDFSFFTDGYYREHFW